MSGHEFVNSYDEIIENVRQFNADLSRGEPGITSLSQFRHWYYIPELGTFGPSKFVGYRNMCAKLYNFGHGKDGRDTEEVLQRWFLKLPSDSWVCKRLMSKLESLLAAHGKSVRKGASVHVPKDYLKIQ
jgi:hypothetical protein